jgi:hydrogenase expression/formation protein HypE
VKYVSMGHGAGGRLTEEIIAMARASFPSKYLDSGLDSALLPAAGEKIAFTTDSFVVRPLFFPGGNIGRLAVCGTVNDLAVVGARPRFLSCALILEEGLAFEDLERALGSMGEAAREADVEIVTGDTKVVERGKGDGIYVATAGIGTVPLDLELSGERIEEGDVLMVSGTLGDHAMTILGAREAFGFESSLQSDCAPLGGLVAALLESGAQVRFLRDLTRGGLAAALNELAELRGLSLEIDEESLPVRKEVRALSEILGIDVPSMANEGKLVAVVRGADADKALAAMRAHRYGREAAIVGSVVEAPATARDAASPGGANAARDSGAARVRIRTVAGSLRILPRPSSEKLPRIC